MRTVTIKTTDLSDNEIQKFLLVFKEVYNFERSATFFKNEYTHTCLGYSFHTILYNDLNEICGSYSLAPFIYIIRGENVLLGMGSDLFIKEGYRDDVSNLISVLNAAIRNAKDVGMAGCFGFPNDNSEKVSRAFLKEKRIGLLDTYILPYRIGDYNSFMKILNVFSILFSNCLLFLSHITSSEKKATYIITKLRPQFQELRFKWFNLDGYYHYDDNQMHCVWKISDFEGIKVCFLMDVYPLTPKNFDKAVRKMVSKEKSSCGLFLYVGHLHFTPLSMIKIPRRFEPKTFRFDCRILDKEKLSKEDVFNIDNWEVDLSSYDLL